MKFRMRQDFLAPLDQSRIESLLHADARFMKINQTVAGQHNIRIYSGKFPQRINIDFFVKINRTAPAEIASQQCPDEVAAYDDVFCIP